MPMVAFDCDDMRFHLRAAAIIVCDGHVLALRIAGDDHWFMPGGRCDLLETTPDALRRELREELDVEAEVGRLLWVSESFWREDDCRYHQVAFFFEVVLPAVCPQRDPAWTRELEDGGSSLIAEWLPLDTLPGRDIWPTFLPDALAFLPDVTTHVIHVDAAV